MPAAPTAPANERVYEPVVVDEPGVHDLLLATRARDRARACVVLSTLGIGVTLCRIPEFGKHPWTEDGHIPG